MNYFLLADSHLQNTGESLAEFSDLLAALKKYDATAELVHLGDIVDDGNPETFQKATKIMTENFSHLLLTLGNHDLIWRPEIPESAWVTEDLYDGHPQLLATYRNVLNLEDYLFYEREDAESIFLVLCTQHKIKESCACYLEKEQLTWLQEKLAFYQKNNEIRPIFIISHQALNHTHLGSSLYGGFGPQDKDVKEILWEVAPHLNVYFLNGHLHNGIHKPPFTNFGPVKLVDLPPVCPPHNGYPNKNVVTYLTVTNGKVIWQYFHLISRRRLEEVEG